MKKRLIILLTLFMCILFIAEGYAKDGVTSILITKDKTIEYDKEELLSSLYEADIESIREAIDMKLITCRELTEYYLERIEEYNSTFNCFITLCDNVLAEADKRDEAIADGTAKGKLFGVPIVVKDNIKYKGYYTTNGHKFSDSTISEVNATIVQYLLDEGAIIIGKGNMSTDAQSAYRTHSKAVGETFNAYNKELSAGGSSGGSAVATSLNFATASLGTDTNSSLRYPAALSGCVSLRPTFGLVDKEGCIILNKRRDTPGAITRTVKDQAIMLDVITGNGTYADNLNADALKGMRIGILENLSYAVSGVSGRTSSVLDAEIQTAFANAVEEFKACGAEVVKVSLSGIFTMTNACAENKDGWEAAKEKYYAAFEKLLKDNNIEAVIFPTYLTAPMYTGVSSDGGLRVYDQPYTSNCSILSPTLGLPEISIPIGQHSRGAGIGLEIASLKNNEQLLLDIAYSYTERYNHRVAPQTAPNLYKEYNLGNLEKFLSEYKEALSEVERLKAEENKQQVIIIPEPSTPTEETTPDKGQSEPIETSPNSGKDNEQIIGGNDDTSSKIKVDFSKIAMIVVAVIVTLAFCAMVVMAIYERHRSLHRVKYKNYRKHIGKNTRK